MQIFRLRAIRLAEGGQISEKNAGPWLLRPIIRRRGRLAGLLPQFVRILNQARSAQVPQALDTSLSLKGDSKPC